MFEDDRPINPDRNYLQQANAKYQEKRKREILRNNLKKDKDEQSFDSEKDNRNIQIKVTKTKKQIYEQIVKVNRQKFGEWDRKPKKQEAKKQQQKKIKPKDMTVDYKHKTVKIDTTQYKKPNYVPQKIQDQKKLNEKQEYTQMVQYLKAMYEDFNKQKQQFQSKKQYLQFKKKIETVPKIEVESKLNFQNKNKIQQKILKQNLKGESNNILKTIENKNPESLDDESAESNSKQKINTIYTIQKLHECHPFNLTQIYKYTERSCFVSSNSELAIKAKSLLLNRPHGKVKIIKPVCPHKQINSNQVSCSQKQCQQKRITKFPNGWFELWIAGKYRTAYNKQLQYKIIWHSNGDIVQEFHLGKIRVYESKIKNVVQVKVGNHLPFYYFPLLDQLETKDKQGNTQVIYSDGRHEIILVNKDEQMH